MICCFFLGGQTKNFWSSFWTAWRSCLSTGGKWAWKGWTWCWGGWRRSRRGVSWKKYRWCTTTTTTRCRKWLQNWSEPTFQAKINKNINSIYFWKLLISYLYSNLLYTIISLMLKKFGWLSQNEKIMFVDTITTR